MRSKDNNYFKDKIKKQTLHLKHKFAAFVFWTEPIHSLSKYSNVQWVTVDKYTSSNLRVP